MCFIIVLESWLLQHSLQGFSILYCTVCFGTQLHEVQTLLTAAQSSHGFSPPWEPDFKSSSLWVCSIIVQLASLRIVFGGFSLHPFQPLPPTEGLNVLPRISSFSNILDPNMMPRVNPMWSRSCEDVTVCAQSFHSVARLWGEKI